MNNCKRQGIVGKEDGDDAVAEDAGEGDESGGDDEGYGEGIEGKEDGDGAVAEDAGERAASGGDREDIMGEGGGEGIVGGGVGAPTEGIVGIVEG